MAGKENADTSTKPVDTNWRQLTKDGRKRDATTDPKPAVATKKPRIRDSDGHLLSGRIVSIELENFMCHEKLKVEFDVENSNCFYIGGPNGSGKSALFAAMNIGLGGRGNQNDRGNSVKCYIKEGKRQAKIRITLTNRGQSRHSAYGDVVIVERTITESSSTYQIKKVFQEGGRRKEEKITSRKSDLDKLMDRYSIQLANPIFWMSQDRSRQFLQQMKPESLYQIFIYATELDHTRICYDKASETLAEMNRVTKLFHKQLDEKKVQIRKVQEQEKQQVDISKRRLELNDLGWILMWLDLRDVLEEIEHLETKKQTAVANMDDNKKVSLANREERTRIVEEAEAVKNNILEFAQDSKGKNEERAKKEAEWKDAEEDVKNCNGELVDNEKKCKQIMHSIRMVKQEIAKAEKEMQSSQGETDKNRLQKRLQECEDEMRQLNEKQRLAVQEKEAAGEEAESADHNFQKAKTDLKLIQSDSLRVQSEIRQARAVKGDSIARFGEDVPKILQLVKHNANKFRREPIGPIGSYLTVQDAKWTFAIEEAIGRNLASFALDNQDDRKTFEQLLKANRIQSPSTIVIKFDTPSHDTRQNEPPSNSLTVDRVLRSSNHVVRNLLIDIASIEQTLLIEDDNEARELLDGNCPPNVRVAFTRNGSKGNGRTAAGQGQYRFHPYLGGPNSRARFLTAASNVDENALQDDLAKLQKTAEQQSTVVRAEEKKYREAMKARDDADRRMREAGTKKSRLMDEKKTMKRDLEAMEDKDDDTTLHSMRESLAEAERRLRAEEDERITLEAELERAHKKAAEAKKVMKEAELVVKEQKIKLDPLEKKKEQLRKDIDQLDALYEGMNRKKTTLVTMLAKCDDEMTVLERKKDAAEENAAKSKNLPKPSRFSDPPDLKNLPRTEDARKGFNELEERIKAAVKAAPKLDISKEKMEEMIESYRDGVKHVKRLAAIQKKLRMCVGTREERFPIMRHAITMRLKISFQKLMAIRHFVGELRVRNEAKAIDIFVHTHRKEEAREHGKLSGANVLQDLKGLSGGERSYTTACFIMSLWEIMEAPFRCMDEFDVFMDMVNRKVIMDLLVKLATENFSHCQFIFFTPQGIREVANRKGVQVFEMPKVRD